MSHRQNNCTKTLSVVLHCRWKRYPEAEVKLDSLVQELIHAGNKSRQRDDELSSALSRTQGSPVTPASSLMNRQKVTNVSDVPAQVAAASDGVECPPEQESEDSSSTVVNIIGEYTHTSVHLNPDDPTHILLYT